MLPLPRFVLQPFTAVVVAAVHVYLAAGHLWSLFGGDVQWTHAWKGFGALASAYVFAALASRGLSETQRSARGDDAGRADENGLVVAHRSPEAHQGSQ